MGSTGNKSIFVGYTTSTKIWKLYDPIARRSFMSRDIAFYEGEKYYKGGWKIEWSRRKRP
jgi:hypothetical protein